VKSGDGGRESSRASVIGGHDVEESETQATGHSPTKLTSQVTRTVLQKSAQKVRKVDDEDSSLCERAT
jgi:hypothetical protein